MLDICLLGTGGMMPLPSRRLTSLMARYNGSSILIDCGEGTQVAIREKGWSFHDIDVILLTHFHADHVSGLPGLLLSIGNAQRTTPLFIYGPKGAARIVAALRTIAPELPYPVYVTEFSGDTTSFEAAGCRIEGFKLNHNVVCYGYSIVVERAGKFDPDKARDNDVPLKLWNRLQKGEEIDFEGRHFTQDMILGPARKGLKVTYCTDTRPIAGIATAAREADLFICEGMYGEEGSEDKAREHKHMTFAEAATLAKKANVRKLWLTHYSPSLVRAKDYVNVATAIFPGAWAARDLESVTLKFEDEAGAEGGN
ncbi:MAG: ribonuclease Z [Lachnospiraceae bacterium]|nr:ribonuclease Z [Lachnospiraceae bacterium]